MKKNFASVATMLALAATTAFTSAPAFAQASYPQGAPPPSAMNDPANNNYAPIPDDYYGTPMTQQGLNAVAAGGPRTAVLYYARKGFTEAPLPDGERIGVEFNLDPNGWAYFERSYDLNNPDELELYNENLNAEIQLNADRQAMAEAGRWNGPGFYFGRFNTCWGRDRGFKVIVGVGGPGVIFADPYRFELGFPFIVEPVFGFGFGRRFDHLERERRIEFERERFHERFSTFYGHRFPGREFHGDRGNEGRREFPGGRGNEGRREIPAGRIGNEGRHEAPGGRIGNEGRRDFPGIPQHDPRFPAGGNTRIEHQQPGPRSVPTLNPNPVMHRGGGPIERGHTEQRGGGFGREAGGGRQVAAPGRHHE
jgi:hypothetical protein